MNISPINLVNFKSTVINMQSSKQAKEVNATSPINNTSVSSETLKANFCPQIAFMGKKDSNKSVKLSQDTIDAITAIIESVYDIDDDGLDDDLVEKLQNGTAIKEDLLNILKTANESGDTVAHRLAFQDPESYIEATKDFSKKERLNLLKMADEDGETVAGNLIENNPYFYIDATKDFSKKERLNLLKMADIFGGTVTHRLVSDDNGESGDKAFLDVTKDFSKKERLKLLKMTNEWGSTVAHDLAEINAESYVNATQDFSRKERLNLLKMADSNGDTVAHRLTGSEYDYESYYEATKDYTPEEQFEILTLANKDKITVAHKLAYNKDSYKDAYSKAIKDLSKEQKAYLLNMTDNKGVSVKEILEKFASK